MFLLNGLQNKSESSYKLISLTNAPILCYPRYNIQFIICFDDSFTSTGDVLLKLW